MLVTENKCDVTRVPKTNHLRALIMGLLVILASANCFAQKIGYQLDIGSSIIGEGPIFPTAIQACDYQFNLSNKINGPYSLLPPMSIQYYGAYPNNLKVYECNSSEYIYSTPPQRTLFLFAEVQQVETSILYDPTKNLGDANSCSCGDGSTTDDSSSASTANTQGGVMAGDPINITTGNAYRQETDIDLSHWLSLLRFYNSSSLTGLTHFGVNWRQSFDRQLELIDSPLASINVIRPDGRQYFFTKNGGVWTADADIPDSLVEKDDSSGNLVGFTFFVAESRQFENYDATGTLQSIEDLSGLIETFAYSTSATPSTRAPHAGLLLTVTDPLGRQLSFTYNASGNVSQITLPSGGTLAYGYDTNENLTSVTYPDGKVKTYVYNEPSLTGGTSFPNALTGIVDERGARYESTSYIGSGTYAGYASAASRAGNVDATQITYNSNGSTTVQYPLGLSATLGIATVQGVNKVASVSTNCGRSCNQPYSARTYDTNGYPAMVTDWNNAVTKTTFDANGLLDQQIDASGTPSQRTTNTTWDTTLRVPLTRVVLDANGTTVSSTQWVYNSAGQTLARCAIDPGNSAAAGYACSASGTVPAGVRRWTYTYCSAVDATQCPLVGLLLTATGPRTDVAQTTTYSYYLDGATSGCTTPGGACHQPGDLHTVTDPSGHVTTVVSYDADGRVTRETDANGVNTDLTYTPRGWLASRTVGGAQTAFGYTPYGAISSVTDPDGVTTNYDYDAAHRLVKITDAQGNYLQYTLDAACNKTAVQVADASGTAHQSLSRTFNPLGQLTTVVDGLNHTVFNASAAGSYDANGNLVQSSDGMGIQRQASYDALDRLVQTIDNYNGTN